MNPWKPILAALIIFATGVVTGGLLVSHADHVSQKARRPAVRETGRLAADPNPVPPGNPQARPLPQNRGPRVISEEFIRKLDAEVHLTTGQRERIDEIISQGQARNKEIWDRITPELRREMIETQQRIREILTPEQRVIFEEFMKQSRPANRRPNEESGQPGNRPRDPRRLPPREAQENPPPAPQGSP